MKLWHHIPVTHLIVLIVFLISITACDAQYCSDARFLGQGKGKGMIVDYNRARLQVATREPSGALDYRLRASSVIEFNEKLFDLVEYEYLSEDRTRRAFLVVPRGGVRPGLVVALHGSDGDGDGARDLIIPYNSEHNYQRAWPMHLASAYNLPVVAPDSPRFGLYEYKVSKAYQPLLDDVNAVKIAKQLLEARGIEPIRALFVGGVSRGAVRASFFGATVLDVSHVYMAGSIIDRHVDRSTPERSPPEWEKANFNYSKMIGHGVHATWRLVYGEGDYVYKAHSFPEVITDEMSRLLKKRFSTSIVDVGHVISIDDILSFADKYARCIASN